MSKIEAAARAMCLSEGEDPDTVLALAKVPLYGPRGYLVAPPVDHNFPAWRCYTPLAQTCLGAVAGPTTAMLTAGVNALRYHCDATPELQAESVWRAMHAAMLAEQETP
jgi:hypothetical protein